MITKILAEEIKDSRGNPTIKVTVWLAAFQEIFLCPSGRTGVHEAHELRDADGKGVKTAIEKVNSMIAPALAGKNVLSQKEIDGIMIELDGTQNKDNLGSELHGWCQHCLRESRGETKEAGSISISANSVR